MSAELAALMAELLAEFLDELPRRCGEFEECIMALESGNDGAFDELYRQVHSLKGTAGGVGLPIVTTICHQFESFLSEARSHFDQARANTALAYVDLVRRTTVATGRDAAGVNAIEQALDAMRAVRLRGRASILVVDSSQALRRVYLEEFSSPLLQVHTLDNGMQALERLLHEPFDLLIVSRELSGLNGIAVIAALREARCRNSQVPVILVSSNTAPVPAHLQVGLVARRDKDLVPSLKRQIAALLEQARAT